jgi:glycosyltransferase involved in cell wall biosynthesis
MGISVLILTKNEEANLPLCLEAARWCDDVVVLDSGSTDRTVEIAETFGARVYHRPWDTEPAQRAFSLSLPFRHPWVYNPDADEIATPELIAEMLAVTGDASRPEVCYRVRRKDMFMGKWLRHSSLYPTWFPRLFRPERIRFERLINMAYVADGPEARLQEHMLHYSFNNGLDAWFAKHNMYSTAEALEAIRTTDAGRIRWCDLVFGSTAARRRALKDLSFFLPLRPLLRFVYSYVCRLGFLDGRAGLTYCRLLMAYEFMIDIKVREARRRARGFPV